MSVQHRMLKNKTQIPNKVNNPIHKNNSPNLGGVCVSVCIGVGDGTSDIKNKDVF
jgi:hypothetical protein